MTIQELEAKIKEFSLELEKLKKEEETKQIKPWKSGLGEQYYYVSHVGECLEWFTHTNLNSDFNDRCYDFGNYYRTKQLAKQDAKEQKLRNRVRQLRDTLCEGYKFNRADYNYCIYYSTRDKKFEFGERYVFYIGEIYFDDAEHAEQACNVLNNEFNEAYMEEIFNGN